MSKWNGLSLIFHDVTKSLVDELPLILEFIHGDSCHQFTISDLIMTLMVFDDVEWARLIEVE